MKNKEMTNALVVGLIVASFAMVLSAFGASSFTPNYNLEMPAAGDTGWADAINSNAIEIDEQMFINQSSITNHVTDTVGAHAATAISTTVGTVCASSTTAQSFLLCLDDQIDAVTGGGVVTLAGDQTVTGQKTFSAATVFSDNVTVSSLGLGVCHLNANGLLSSSEIVNADISASAAIARSKMATGTAHQIVVNDGSGNLSGTALTNGQLLIGSTGAAASAASLTGTTNQITVTGGAGSITLSTPQSIATTSDVTFDDITGSTSVLTPLVKATSSAGLTFQANNATQVGVFGAGGGAQAVFNGAVESKVSLIVEDPGAGSNTVTLAAPTLAGSYSLTLPTTDGSSNEVLSTNGSGVLSWVSPKSLNTAPTIQRFTSGSGTYTTPAGVLYIKVTIVGGGGGGAGSGQTVGTAATDGGTTTFGSALLSATGGVKGTQDSTGGAGGTGSISSPAYGSSFPGGAGGGGYSIAALAQAVGSSGGSSIFGGNGSSRGTGSVGSAGNNGGGGGGGSAIGLAGAASVGGGGGAGGSVTAIVPTPSSTYSYAVGSGGTAGLAGTNGSAGGAGGSGLVVVEEFYQ